MLTLVAPAVGRDFSPAPIWPIWGITGGNGGEPIPLSIPHTGTPGLGTPRSGGPVSIFGIGGLLLS